MTSSSTQVYIHVRTVSSDCIARKFGGLGNPFIPLKYLHYMYSHPHYINHTTGKVVYYKVESKYWEKAEQEFRYMHTRNGKRLTNVMLTTVTDIHCSASAIEPQGKGALEICFIH